MFSNKKILIIGGTGTIGRKLVNELLSKDPHTIRIFSRDEFKQFEMMNELREKKNLRFLLGDVRDNERLLRAMEGIDIVFHVAALKQVPACEYNPFEAVKTNVIGTQNVIDSAIKTNVQKVIFTSTDKTISPTNTYGATKLLAERLIASADYHKGNRDISFAAVRFGNVMGSRGSVIPLFKQQILENGYITATDTNMTRFMMTQKQAAELLLHACERAKGGEVFVLKMPVIRLKDLAETIIEEVAKKYNLDEKKVGIKNIGLRPGEKMYEELMTIDESKYAIEFDDMFAIQSMYDPRKHDYKEGKATNAKTYSSDDGILIGKEEIRKIILRENFI